MTEKKLPTLAVIAFLVISVFTSVLAVNQRQKLQAEATQENAPLDVTVTNITDSSFHITWMTTTTSTSKVRWKEEGISFYETTEIMNETYIHDVQLNDLEPATNYDIEIVYDGTQFPVQTRTAPVINPSDGPQILSGKVVTQKGDPVEMAIVYIDIFSAQNLSAVTNQNGNFFVSLDTIRQLNLSSEIDYDDELPVQIEVMTSDGSKTYSINKLGNMNPSPNIVLGEQNNFTNVVSTKDLELPSAKLPSLNISPTSKFSIE